MNDKQRKFTIKEVKKYDELGEIEKNTISSSIMPIGISAVAIAAIAFCTQFIPKEMPQLLFLAFSGLVFSTGMFATKLVGYLLALAENIKAETIKASLQYALEMDKLEKAEERGRTI